MAELLERLAIRGDLCPVAAKWATAHQRERNTTLDTALLELDLVDEESLTRALEACLEIPAATRADLQTIDPAVGKQVPPYLRRLSAMCPVRLAGDELVVLVTRPLSDKTVHRLRSEGREVRQLASPAHYVAVARQQVFNVPSQLSTQQLEDRLLERQRADIRRVLMNVAAAPRLALAASAVLDFATATLDFACLFVTQEQDLQVVAARGEAAPSNPFPFPGSDCTVGAPFWSSSSFAGPLEGSSADRRFFEALERPLPRWAFAAHVPIAGGPKAILYADNGARGIAARWVAELALLAVRLGATGQWQQQRQGELELGAAKTPPGDEASAEQRSQPPELKADESAISDSQPEAAGEADVALVAMVEALRQERAGQPDAELATQMMGELREIVDKLATDLPKQLEVQMETSLRKAVSRLNALPRASPLPASSAPTAASGVDLVRVEGGPREVQTYHSRRKKTKRVML